MITDGWKILIPLGIIAFLSLQMCTGLKFAKVGERGKQLYEQGNYDQAVAELKLSISEYPENAELRYYLGLAYLRQGHMDSAMIAHEQAAEIKSDTGMDSVYSAVMADRAKKLRESEQYEAVHKWVDQAIKLDKRNKRAYYEKYMAKGLQLYYQGSKWELWDAIVAFGNASSARPDNPMPYYYSAKSYQKKDDKDFTNAIDQFNKALEHNPPDKISAEIKQELEDLKRRKKLYEDFWGN